jgi:SAM-dependent methyltransferase
MGTEEREGDNRNAWAEVIRNHQMLYPDERIVVFLANYYFDRAANGERKALDIGFGSGRHLKLLMDYGFHTYGIDYVKDTLEVAQELWKDTSLMRQLKVADVKDKPFPDGFFDVILAWGVIFLRTTDEMERDLSLLRDALKKGGRLIVNFRTKDCWFYGNGTPIGPDTFRLDESAGPYNGMCYTFLDFETALSLLLKVGFTVENHERIDLYRKNQTEHHSWWAFWLRKE